MPRVSRSGSGAGPIRWLQPMAPADGQGCRRTWWLATCSWAGLAGRAVEALVVEPTGPSAHPTEASMPGLQRVCGERESRVLTGRIRMVNKSRSRMVQRPF